MHGIPFLFLVGFLSPLLAYHLYVVKSYLRTRFSRNPNYTEEPKYVVLVAKVHRLMIGFNPYYSQLSSQGKRIFISRVIHLMVFKRFDGKEGLQVTLEKKILVIGALVQLTFGLKRYAMHSFNYIILYPANFFSKLINQQVKGLTSKRGVLLLSWFDVVKGFHIKDDNLNLALHEWAHAFVIDHYDDIAHWVYTKLNASLANLDTLYADMQDYRESQSYLRDYAFTNTHEFFAVCVEHFFETPIKFNQKYPELFKDLCVVLNQNPLNNKGDYALKLS
jgi:Mlc titration factor MtfA (ptsG expression regulator)